MCSHNKKNKVSFPTSHQFKCEWHLKYNDFLFYVVPLDSTFYLMIGNNKITEFVDHGNKLSSSNVGSVPVQYRIDIDWAAFEKNKSHLIFFCISYKIKVKIYNTHILPTLLMACIL